MNTADRHIKLLEALLFASTNPVSEKVISERLPSDANVPALLEELVNIYKERGVNLVRVEKAWAFRTSPDIGPLLIVEKEVVRKLSRAGIETLSIIAYHQPITRTEIEEVRGVSVSKGTMDVLFEAGWIRLKGRRRTPGRPVTWGTSERFLDHFGLESLDHLPGLDELKAAGLLDTRPAIENLPLSLDSGLNGEPDFLEDAIKLSANISEPQESSGDDELTFDEYS